MVLFTFWYLKEQMATWRTSWNFIGTYDFEIMFLETTNKYPSNEQVRYPFPLRHEQKSIVELPEIELTVSAWSKDQKGQRRTGDEKLDVECSLTVIESFWKMMISILLNK